MFCRVIRLKRLGMVVAGCGVLAIGIGLLGMANTVTTAGSCDNWGLHFNKSGEPPIGNATVEQLASHHAYYLGDTAEKTVYLTFDCGYENGYTATILDTLKQKQVPAAFFVVGHYLKEAPDLVKRMVAEGHLVGNHTADHPDMSAIADKAAFQKQLERVEQQYEQLIGRPMEKIYRPPQGKYSEQNLKMADELGYKTVFWSLAYVDWYTEQQPTADAAYAKLLPRMHNGCVLLLHATSATNASILGDLIDRYREMGYTFATLDRLISE